MKLVSLGHNPDDYLNLGLHVLDGVARLDLEGDGLPGESFDEDLHAAAANSAASLSEISFN